MSETKTVKINWDFVVNKILEEECLLVLGPEVYTNPDGTTTHWQELQQHLDLPNNSYILKHYPEDDLYLFDKPHKRTMICHEIQTFYEKKAKPSETLTLLAQIPFHIILTVTPDKTLPKVFDQLGLQYQFGHYIKNREPQAIKKLSKQNPLIYNVFGSADNEESMILTHNDLYDYFKSIFARKSMPDELKLRLLEIKNIIFLGVPFDKWYMQLLLRELEIHNQDYVFMRFAANQTLSDNVMALCIDQFQIQFVAYKPADFVKELHNHFQKLDMLRKASEAQEPIQDRIRKLVSEDRLKEAIDLLGEMVENTILESEVIVLAGRYHRLKNSENQGTISGEDLNIQLNQIRNTILELLQEAESL